MPEVIQRECLTISLSQSVIYVKHLPRGHNYANILDHKYTHQVLYKLAYKCKYVHTGTLSLLTALRQPCVYVCMYICMYVYMYACMYVCMYYVCIYVCMYVCMYICIYTGTRSLQAALRQPCIMYVCMYVSNTGIISLQIAQRQQCVYVCMYVYRDQVTTGSTEATMYYVRMYVCK